MGSKPIGLWCFEYLLKNSVELDVEVVGLLTRDNNNLTHRSLREVASENQVPVLDALDDYLGLPKVDFLFSVQFHKILKQKHIDHAAVAVNLHMAPLPEYRGCNQFSFAILDQKDHFGATLHLIDAGVDSGDILFERRFDIPAMIDVKRLYELTDSESRELWKQYLKSIIDGDYSPVPQSSLVETRGTSIHYRREIEQLKEIDPNWPSERILRHLRATYMPGFSPPYMVIDSVRVGLIPEEGTA